MSSVLLLVTCCLMVSGAGAKSLGVGSQVALHTGEAMVICHLTEDVSQTKRSVIVKHFSKPDDYDPVTVLGCDYLAKNPHHPDCLSHYNFTLEEIQKNSVLARVPRIQLSKDGSYQCQLVPPPDSDHVFTSCLIIYSDDTEDAHTTISPVAPSTTDGQPQPHDQKEKVSTGANGGYQGLVPAVVALSFTVVILLLLNVVLLVVFLRHRRTVTRTSVNTLKKEKQPMNGYIHQQFETEPISSLLEMTKVPCDIAETEEGKGATALMWINSVQDTPRSPSALSYAS